MSSAARADKFAPNILSPFSSVGTRFSHLPGWNFGAALFYIHAVQKGRSVDPNSKLFHPLPPVVFFEREDHGGKADKLTPPTVAQRKRSLDVLGHRFGAISMSLGLFPMITCEVSGAGAKVSSVQFM